jgi:hydrogenase nickel incorporation protein HypB
MQVPVVEKVLKLNDEIAALNRQTLKQAGIFTIDLIGAPGCGKTSLIEHTCRKLNDKVRIGVIVGDLTTRRDADRMAHFTEQVVQVNTGRGCHLEANHVRQAMASLDLSRLDFLIIENVGNLVCPVGFDLGQDMKVGMFSVSEGDDKPAKYPYLVHESQVLLLNKMDLIGLVPFDRGIFHGDVRRLNPDVEVIEISILKDTGFERWLKWLEQHLRPKP